MRPFFLFSSAVACYESKHWCYVAIILYFVAVILLICVILLAVKCNNSWGRWCSPVNKQSKTFLSLFVFSYNMFTFIRRGARKHSTRMIKSLPHVQPAINSQSHSIKSSFLLLMHSALNWAHFNTQELCQNCLSEQVLDLLHHLTIVVSQLWREITPPAGHEVKKNKKKMAGAARGDSHNCCPGGH